MTDQTLLPAWKDRRRWNARGLNQTQEMVFHWIAPVVTLLLALGWGWSIWASHTVQGRVEEGELASRGMTASPIGRSTTERLSDALTGTPQIHLSFLNEAIRRYESPLRGESGKLRAVIGLPGQSITKSTDPGLGFKIGQSTTTELMMPAEPGVYQLALEFRRLTRGIENFHLISMVPFDEKREGRIGTYRLGSWPYERGGKPLLPSYADPPGFIQVTMENRDVHVSEHFRLRDFLTKDQADVWPKYVLINPAMLDKLELAIEELKKMGVDVRHVTVMSGFRTPRYNAGGGNTGGRANLSRHMYGDGVDIYLDNDKNFWTDDVNGDGRVSVADAEMMAKAVERVEQKYPELVGGIGIYPACCGHGPFVHVDVRGKRARWRGTGSG